MPTYVFKCPVHPTTLTLEMTISEYVKLTRPRCQPDCGLEMETVIQPTSFALRGSGWAKDGYSGGKK